MRIISIFSSMLRLLSFRMSLIDGSLLRLLEDLVVLPLLLDVVGFGAGDPVVGFGVFDEVEARRRASSIPSSRSLRDMPVTPEPFDRESRSSRAGRSST